MCEGKESFYKFSELEIYRLIFSLNMLGIG